MADRKRSYESGNEAAATGSGIRYCPVLSPHANDAQLTPIIDRDATAVSPRHAKRMKLNSTLEDPNTISTLILALYLRIVPNPKYADNPELDNDYYATLVELANGIIAESRTDKEAAEFVKELLETEYVPPVMEPGDWAEEDFADFDEWDIYLYVGEPCGEGRKEREVNDGEEWGEYGNGPWISNAEAGLDWR
ncbi:hypothetical protein BJ508DRAFT_306382 [Ascobolus immersus RN42]|uniref:Uncharacterized protein n=1 Tax=Ascobolus immersus RN42 TaxID=1160509 RepID=A0A3N4IA35_ASCIM|nr:hypothetical protein BJ508DRAFT_306382 [Ascobolus immersus RN42]